MNAYEQLLHDLGAILEIHLKPDPNQSCKLEMNGVTFQIDLDSLSDDLLIGCNLGRIMPGPYREGLFKQALKVNGLTRIPRGNLAFTSKNDCLILFQFLSFGAINGENLYQFLLLFVDHAKIWIDSLTRGEIPALEEDTSRGQGMFGLT